MNNNVYEKIDYHKEAFGKVFLTCIDKSEIHWHYSYEIILVLEGEIQVLYGPEPILVKAGELLLINSRMVHGIQSNDRKNICLFIQLPLEVFEPVFMPTRKYHFQLNSQSTFCVPKVGYSYFVRKVAEIGAQSLRKDVIGQIRVNSLTLALIADLVEYVDYDVYLSQIQKDKKETSDFDKLNTYIREHISSTTLPKDIYQTFGMGEKTLYRHLKMTLGLTLKELILRIRIEQASNLLKTTDKPIAVIATACGFGSEVSFYRAFRKDTELTPNEYRKGGTTSNRLKDVQGYLSFNTNEAKRLLKYYSDL